MSFFGSQVLNQNPTILNVADTLYSEVLSHGPLF